MTWPRNHIEFRDANPDTPGHVTSSIFIDGVEVAVERDSFHLATSDTDATKVTVTLLPHRVTFK